MFNLSTGAAATPQPCPTEGIMRGNQAKGMGWAKDNMEVFKLHSVHHSHHHLLSDVTAGCIWLAERCAGTLSSNKCKEKKEKKKK